MATRHPVILLDGPPALRTYWFIEPPGVQSEHECGINDLLWDEVYYHDENRFYTCTGKGGFPKVYPCPDELSENVHDAVDAALSARFEFGETGGIKQAFKRAVLG